MKNIVTYHTLKPILKFYYLDNILIKLNEDLRKHSTYKASVAF